MNILKLWKENPHVSLIISGVDKNFSKESILPEGYNSDNIYFDNISESTYQNAISINKWIKENSLKKIKVITSYYHMPRSMFLLKVFSPDTEFYAYPVKKVTKKMQSIEKYILLKFFLIFYSIHLFYSLDFYFYQPLSQKTLLLNL